MAIVDLLAILPFYFGVFFDLDLRFVGRLLNVCDDYHHHGTQRDLPD